MFGVRLFRGAQDAKAVALRQSKVGQHQRGADEAARRHTRAARFVFDVRDRFGLLDDIGLDAILFRDGGQAFLLDDRAPQRIVHVDELGVERVDLALQGVGECLAPAERVTRPRHSIAPVLFALGGVRRRGRGRLASRRRTGLARSARSGRTGCRWY